MKKINFILTLFFLHPLIFSQDINFDLESQFFYNNYIKNETFQFISLQTTLTAFDAKEKIRVRYKNTVENTKFNLDLRCYIKPVEKELDYNIDSAYFSYEQGSFILYTGKQRIKWGVGFTFNPTDKLQPTKNILNPAYDLEGFYALRMEYSNEFLTPSFIIAPDPKATDKDFLENIKFALQLYKLVGSADFFVNGIYQMNNLQMLGLSISYDLDFFVLNIETAALRFMEPSLAIARSAGILDDIINYSILSGISKMFNSLTVIFEYYYNGWGLKNAEFNDFVNLIGITQLGIKKNYFSLNFSYVWEEKISTVFSIIYGADDSCFLFYPRVEYIENSNFNIELGFIENITDKGKETYYTTPLFNSLILKLKAYF